MNNFKIVMFTLQTSSVKDMYSVKHRKICEVKNSNVVLVKLVHGFVTNMNTSDLLRWNIQKFFCCDSNS